MSSKDPFGDPGEFPLLLAISRLEHALETYLSGTTKKGALALKRQRNPLLWKAIYDALNEDLPIVLVRIVFEYSEPLMAQCLLDHAKLEDDFIMPLQRSIESLPLDSASDPKTAQMMLVKVLADFPSLVHFHRTVIQALTKCRSPEPWQLMKFLEPQSTIASGIFMCLHRLRSCFHGQDGQYIWNALDNMLQVFAWYDSNTPAKFVAAQLECADFYNNRILVASKKLQPEKKELYVRFVQTLRGFMLAQRVYFQKHFPHGMTWNPKGQNLLDFVPDREEITYLTFGTATPRERLEFIAQELERLCDV